MTETSTEYLRTKVAAAKEFMNTFDHAIEWYLDFELKDDCIEWDRLEDQRRLLDQHITYLQVVSDLLRNEYEIAKGINNKLLI